MQNRTAVQRSVKLGARLKRVRSPSAKSPTVLKTVSHDEGEPPWSRLCNNIRACVASDRTLILVAATTSVYLLFVFADLVVDEIYCDAPEAQAMTWHDVLTL